VLREKKKKKRKKEKQTNKQEKERKMDESKEISRRESFTRALSAFLNTAARKRRLPGEPKTTAYVTSAADAG